MIQVTGPYSWTVYWALSHLSLAGLVIRPKRGLYQITDLGVKYLTSPDNLRQYVKSKIVEREAAKRSENKESKTSTAEILDLPEETPQEVLNAVYENIRLSMYDAILDTILSKKPYEFEKLVVMLMDKMGYGGQVANAGEVTQATNDGGIDGIIREDVLGLGKIHLQAKRYARKNTISRDEIQKFVGALAVADECEAEYLER